MPVLGTDSLDGKRPVTARDWRRFKWETRVLYFISIGLAIFVAFLAGRLDDVSDRTLTSLRAGCEGVNALRVNQGLGISEQIVQTERSLRSSLGALEPFRKQIEESVDLRRVRLARLRATVAHPLPAEKALWVPMEERPYREDCAAVFP
jgi:hypothetical protein